MVSHDRHLLDECVDDDRRARPRQGPHLARRLLRLHGRAPARARAPAAAVGDAAQGDRAPRGGDPALPPLGAHHRRQARAPRRRASSRCRSTRWRRSTGRCSSGARWRSSCAARVARRPARDRARGGRRRVRRGPGAARRRAGRSRAASASAWSGPTAPARPCCCACWPASLEPRNGTRWVGPSIEVGYLSQAAGDMPGELSVIDALRGGRSMTEEAAVRLLMRFLFDYEQIRRPVSTLSGGERTRLAFLGLMEDRAQLPRARRADQPPRHRLDRGARGRARALRRHGRSPSPTTATSSTASPTGSCSSPTARCAPSRAAGRRTPRCCDRLAAGAAVLAQRALRELEREGSPTVMRRRRPLPRSRDRDGAEDEPQAPAVRPSGRRSRPLL